MPNPDYLDEIFPTLYRLPKTNVINEKVINYGKNHHISICWCIILSQERIYHFGNICSSA